MRILLPLAVTALVGCGETREEAARRIGELDIDPRKTFGTLKKVLGPHAQIRDASDHKTKDLVKVELSPKAWSEPPLLEIWFHSSSRNVAAAARPIMVIARPPFKGTVMGVRPGESRETAWPAVRRREPFPPRDFPGAGPPRPTAEGWTIALHGEAHLTWEPRPPRKDASQSTGETGELRFADRYYTVHPTAVTINAGRRADRPAPAAASPGSFPFMLYAEAYHTAMPLRFFVDGKLVTEPGGRPERPPDFEIASSSEDGPVLEAQVLLPCGWRKARVSENLRLMPRVGADGKFTEHGSVRFGIYAEFPLNYILVDNRGRPATTLKLGEFSHAIPADDKVALRLPAPDCELAATVELDGKPIAKLPVASSEKAKDDHYLLDPSGKRCYQYKLVLYGTPLNDKRDPPIRLAAMHLHRLPSSVDHAFEKAPDRIKVFRMFAAPSSGARSQLLDFPC